MSSSCYVLELATAWGEDPRGLLFAYDHLDHARTCLSWVLAVVREPPVVEQQLALWVVQQGRATTRIDLRPFVRTRIDDELVPLDQVIERDDVQTLWPRWLAEGVACEIDWTAATARTPALEGDRLQPGESMPFASASIAVADAPPTLLAGLSEQRLRYGLTEVLEEGSLAGGFPDPDPAREPPDAGPVAAPARDYGALASRVLRPSRPNLAPALEAVAGLTDPRAAWEALAARGLIAFEWTGPRVRYKGVAHCARCQGTGYVVQVSERRGARERPCDDCYGSGGYVTERDEPPTALDCAAFAADAAAVQSTEALACEAAARLHRVAGDEPPPARIRWALERTALMGVVPVNAPRERIMTVASAADAALRRHLAAQLPPREQRRIERWRDAVLGAVNANLPLRGDEYSLRGAMLATVRGHAAWLSAAALRVPLDSPAPGARTYAELPDPFEPLLEVWSLGYAVSGVNDDEVVLVAPALRAERGGQRGAEASAGVDAGADTLRR